MKQVLNVGIGGRSFVIDEDAFDRLNSYLNAFRSKTGMGYQTKEVMDDLEMRIAEIFSESLSSRQEVVDISLVERVIAQLGMPDGSDIPGNTGYNGTGSTADSGEYWHSGHDSRPVKKLYRDTDHNVIGGVASGLACYFDVDVLVIRILFVFLFLFGSFGGWIYIILWIAVPAARTSAEKCRMHGLPVTAENMRRRHSHGSNEQCRERKDPDAPGSAGILHPQHPKQEGLLRIVHPLRTQGRPDDSGRRHHLPAADTAEEPGTAHLPLGGIPPGTAPQILSDHRQGPAGSRRDGLSMAGARRDNPSFKRKITFFDFFRIYKNATSC